MSGAITLRRVQDTVFGIHGVLYLGQEPLCVTLERSWKDNVQNISAIPCGNYRVTTDDHIKFGRCYRLHNVPQRFGILIHCGNSIKDTTGCILVGRSFHKGGIAFSKDAMQYLHSVLPFEFWLSVTR